MEMGKLTDCAILLWCEFGWIGKKHDILMTVVGFSVCEKK